MTKDEHENTDDHKKCFNDAKYIIKKPGEFDGLLYCKFCDKSLTYGGTFLHDRSVNHMIAIKKSYGEDASNREYYLCKICNTEVKWNTLYDHEMKHSQRKRNKFAYKCNRTKSHCGLCKFSVFIWEKHLVASTHLKHEKMFMKTGKLSILSIEDHDSDSTDSEYVV